MARKIGKAAGLIAGILLALFSAFQILTFPNFLRGHIQRPWLHNIDVVPVDEKLFLVCLAALVICLALDWLLLSGFFKSIPRSRIIAIIAVLIFFLAPLKNSALQPSMFFSLGGLAAILIFISTSGLQSNSLRFLQKAWARITGINRRIWQALIFLASLAICLCCSSFLFFRFGHGLDEIDYLFQARIFAGGHLWAPMPQPYDFFHLVNLIAKDGKWMAQYPPGWPALLSIGVRLGAAWIVNPLLAGLLVVVIYRLARELFGEDTGRAASLLAVFSPYLTIMGSSMMSHTSSALALILFLLLLWQSVEKKSFARAFLAFLCLGIAASIRPFSAFLICLTGAGLAVYECRKNPLELIKLGMAAVTGMAIPLGLLFYYNHLTTGSALLFGYQYLNSRTADLGFGVRQFPFPHTLREGLLVFHARMVLISEKVFETPVPAVALAALAFVLRKPDRKLVWLAAIFLALPLGHIFYFGNDMMYPPRYIFESVPGLIILAAAGVSAARDKWGNNPGLAHYGLVLAALAFFIFIPAHILSWRNAGDIGDDFPRLLKEHRVKGALVLVQELYYPMGMIQQSPFLDGDNIYARDLPGRRQEIMARFPAGRSGFSSAIRFRKNSI